MVVSVFGLPPGRSLVLVRLASKPMLHLMVADLCLVRLMLSCAVFVGGKPPSLLLRRPLVLIIIIVVIVFLTVVFM